MILVGTNIPGLAPLEEGSGAVFSYKKQGGEWVRSEIRSNPEPTDINYNAMIVVTCDIDQDGDKDLALSGAFHSSSVGNWMENTGQDDPAWIPHLQPMDPGTAPYIRGTPAYKCTDLNHDGYPEVIYNGMFDIAATNPPRYRGEIWLAVNPGPEGWDAPWQMVVIDDDNWASADMWFHDFDGDGYLDLVANQIFGSTVTRYRHPGDNLDASWEPEVIISGLTSPSDMWLEDMDGDGELDVDQLLSPSRDLVLPVKDVGETGEYHVVAVLYVEGGGKFQPESGVDYMAHGEKVTFGEGKVDVTLDLVPAP
jgi:hypothetical protein